MSRTDHLRRTRERALDCLPHSPRAALVTMLCGLNGHVETAEHWRLREGGRLLERQATASEARVWIEGVR